MTLANEAARSLTSAFNILRFVPSAYDGFNVTIEGFWRSFAAVPIILPMSWIMSHAGWLALVAAGEQAQPIDLYRVSLYVLLFSAVWPFLAALMARQFGLGVHFIRYIIAYNWISVPLAGLLLIPDLLFLAGVVGPGVKQTLSLVASGASLYYTWHLARTAFETTGLIAAAFSIADILLSVALTYLVSL